MTIDQSGSTEKVLMISSDGHVTARMKDYRPYIPASLHDEFDGFLKLYAEKGARLNEPASMIRTYDDEIVQQWQVNVIEEGRLEGTWDLEARMKEMARAGLAAEVLFPDFGLPFELYAPFQEALLGYHRTPKQRQVANQAYNRWLADFCSGAPERFAGLAAVSFDDIDFAVTEIRWAKENGLRGVLLPMFPDEFPVFHGRYDRIWSTLEELEMPVNSHIAVSAATQALPTISPPSHPTAANPIFAAPVFFFCQILLSQLIWGGVLERHPNLAVVLTEQGSGWTISQLKALDYTWEGSYLRRDVREAVPLKPSDYFRRQCHLGSSIFSYAEVQARHEIGVDKMTLGMDYPHPEGTWGLGPGHLEYLRATVGAASVPPEEARLLLGGNAVKLWGFDTNALQPVVDEIGFSMDDILTPPDQEYFPRGDVHKPLASSAR
jgi:predicted TIM-barrel fold metal-dependent hydrolase